MLESLALRYREALEQLEALTWERFEELHMVGGGIRNRLLCSFTANAIGRTKLAGPEEASAIGNMLMQLIACGRCADLQEARWLAGASFQLERYEPAGDKDSWNEAYEAFSRLRSETRV